MKRILTFILSFAFVLSLVSLVYAKELKEDNFSDTIDGLSFPDYNKVYSVKIESDWVLIYSKDRKNHTTDTEKTDVSETLYGVAGYNGKENVVSIPEEVNGEKVTRLVEFRSANPIKTLRLHKGIEEINVASLYLAEDDPVRFRFRAEIEEVVVEDSNEVFASKDGVLYTKDLKQIYYYPSAKKDKKFLISETIEHLKDSHFVNNPYLETIAVDKNNPNYSSKDGVLYNKDVTELIYYPLGKKDESFVIPETVKMIKERTALGFSACGENKHLKNLTISKNVSWISSEAHTPLLENIYIKNNKIDVNSFDEDETGGPDIPLRADTIHCYENSPIHKVYKEFEPYQNIKLLKRSSNTSSETVSKNETSSKDVSKKPTASDSDDTPEFKGAEVTASEFLAIEKTESQVKNETEDTTSDLATLSGPIDGDSQSQQNNTKANSWKYVILTAVILVLIGGGVFAFKKFKK